MSSLLGKRSRTSDLVLSSTSSSPPIPDRPFSSRSCCYSLDSRPLKRLALRSHSASVMLEHRTDQRSESFDHMFFSSSTEPVKSLIVERNAITSDLESGASSGKIDDERDQNPMDGETNDSISFRGPLSNPLFGRRMTASKLYSYSRSSLKSNYSSTSGSRISCSSGAIFHNSQPAQPVTKPFRRRLCKSKPYFDAIPSSYLSHLCNSLDLSIQHPQNHDNAHRFDTQPPLLRESRRGRQSNFLYQPDYFDPTAIFESEHDADVEYGDDCDRYDSDNSSSRKSGCIANSYRSKVKPLGVADKNRPSMAFNSVTSSVGKDLKLKRKKLKQKPSNSRKSKLSSGLSLASQSDKPNNILPAPPCINPATSNNLDITPNAEQLSKTCGTINDIPVAFTRSMAPASDIVSDSLPTTHIPPETCPTYGLTAAASSNMSPPRLISSSVSKTHSHLRSNPHQPSNPHARATDSPLTSAIEDHGRYSFRSMRSALAGVIVSSSDFPSVRDPDLVEIMLDDTENPSDDEEEGNILYRAF